MFPTQILLSALEIMKSQPTLVDVSIPEVGEGSCAV